MTILTVQHLRVRLGGVPILRDVNLDIRQGEMVALVGRNGAGKTTTFRSIMGLVGVEDGRILLEGQDLLRVPIHKRAAAGIGYMPEDRRLIGDLTVEENILLPAWAMRLTDAQQRLDAVYAIMPELKPRASSKAAQLSGGQQKLVALGRAMMHGKKLLLLDEPFEGVAPALVRRIAHAIQDLQQDARELTIIVAGSNPKQAGLLTDKTYLIERGQTVEGGLVAQGGE